MGLFIYIFSSICIPFLVYRCIFSLLVKSYSMNETMKQIAAKLNQSALSSNRFLSVFFLSILAFNGTWQVLTYYLFSGAYFWFVILTAGLLLLVYFAPIGAILLPFIYSNEKKWSLAKKIYYHFTGTFTFMWGILLVVDRDVKIYGDEGGSNYHYGNASLKILGGLSLIFLGFYLLTLLSANYYCIYKKKEKELSGFEIVCLSIGSSLSNKMKKWRKTNLYKRNPSLFFAFIPLLFLFLSSFFICIFDPFFVINILFLLIPYTILFVLLLLLKKTWNAKKRTISLNSVISILLAGSWFFVFFLLSLNVSMDWENLPKINDFYVAIEIIGLLLNLFSFIWTVIYIHNVHKNEAGT